MFFRKIIYITLAGLLIFNLIFLGIIFHFQKNDLRVAFLDVGQGDAILITQGENQILIDGGKGEEKLLTGLGGLMPFWDRKIEVVLATHPDQDHIGGLSELPKKYAIGALIATKAESASNVFGIFQENYSSENILKVDGKYGVKIKMKDGELDILYPFSSLSEKVYKDTNSTSLVGRLIFGDNEFLLTGDLPEKQEKELVERDVDIRANYLKVSHHGSKYATSQEFLEKVSPFWGIISVGKNNRYGHPGEEMLQRLRNNQVEILRTDEEGSIVFVCEKKSASCQREEL